MNGETVDLIYLAPLFFSNRNYEVIWGDAGEKRSFEDRWEGGMEHYIGWLKERVEHMHRVLKPTGSIFLHCDRHADAYTFGSGFWTGFSGRKTSERRLSGKDKPLKRVPVCKADIWFIKRYDFLVFKTK
ncbi:DNA methyltransferase [Treponema endosymbiont of Eucomonympha sp.]|uniref:DNA methyltransferase n=1 Tax=Treponema endosymbiont of Eucomonympha sp. TaxID=1580831 RepID=UPI0007508E81|nr:DNA methyltransferase [Treponema endosymbiont of Eucomonympha sp.]